MVLSASSVARVIYVSITANESGLRHFDDFNNAYVGFDVDKGYKFFVIWSASTLHSSIFRA